MSAFRYSLEATLLAISMVSLGCTDAYKQSYIAKHVLGLSDKEMALVDRARPVPFEDLQFDIETTRKAVTVRISSGKWEIVGFGTGGSGTKLILSEIAGIPNPSGGMKSHTEMRTPGTKLSVIVLDQDGNERGIYQER